MRHIGLAMTALLGACIFGGGDDDGELTAEGACAMAIDFLNAEDPRVGHCLEECVSFDADLSLGNAAVELEINQQRGTFFYRGLDTDCTMTRDDFGEWTVLQCTIDVSGDGEFECGPDSMPCGRDQTCD